MDKDKAKDLIRTCAIQNFLSWCDLTADIRLMRKLSPEERAALAEAQGFANVPEYSPSPNLEALISDWCAFQEKLEKDS
jgi:hypothetical protein